MRFLLLPLIVATAAAQTDSLQLAPNVALKGKSTNLFESNRLILGKTATLRTNGVAVNLTATNVVLQGLTYVEANGALELDFSMTGASPASATRKDYVDAQSVLIVDNLAALLASASPPGYRAAIVLQDTSNDGASGDWFFNPTSTASATSLIKIPNDRNPVSLGRWIKR